MVQSDIGAKLESKYNFVPGSWDKKREEGSVFD
jgi:hypothetical protein